MQNLDQVTNQTWDDMHTYCIYAHMVFSWNLDSGFILFSLIHILYYDIDLCSGIDSNRVRRWSESATQPIELIAQKSGKGSTNNTDKYTCSVRIRTLKFRLQDWKMSLDMENFDTHIGIPLSFPNRVIDQTSAWSMTFFYRKLR